MVRNIVGRTHDCALKSFNNLYLSNSTSTWQQQIHESLDMRIILEKYKWSERDQLEHDLSARATDWASFSYDVEATYRLGA